MDHVQRAVIVRAHACALGSRGEIARLKFFEPIVLLRGGQLRPYTTVTIRGR